MQLESCYWKASFPQMRDRFRCGIVYLIVTDLLWMVGLSSQNVKLDSSDTPLQIYHMVSTPFAHAVPYHIGGALIVFVAAAILGFTFTQRSYQRFYLPTSFLSMFLLCVVSLLVFSLQQHPLIRCSTHSFGLKITIMPTYHHATAVHSAASRRRSRWSSSCTQSYPCHSTCACSPVLSTVSYMRLAVIGC